MSEVKFFIIGEKKKEGENFIGMKIEFGVDKLIIIF